ncbi:hypothetical protein VPT02_103 [Vibrio phage VPT02]|uniref:Uncharacterized protein n=1 Tax=Vibrio phage pVp-1 TaxID=1150989 RepID=H6WXD2_9CAUD|nr:hypothetical protein F404_gp041 [Vibrio phage pVp-1]AFB83898.1 hypothetical protein pVp-1_0041 [Vibrio phage pVp-1]QIG60679.1 hypothetical protein VPT02_103 [Vibrio phage VPT02]
MDALKDKLIENPKLQCGVGLASATSEEIEEMCDWLAVRGIPYVHQTTHLKTGKPLPKNGLLIINIIGVKNAKNLH